MPTLAIIAPKTNLDTTTEIMRSITGFNVQLCDGNVDRAKLEMFLAHMDAEIVHFMGHGDLNVTQLSDGLLEAEELANLLRKVCSLRVVVLTACSSAGTGTEIHNYLHLPVVVMQAPIGDPAAVKFSETFYRSYRSSDGDLRRSFTSALQSVRRFFPTFAEVPLIINGDMATDTDLSEFMTYVQAKLSAIQADMTKLSDEVKEMRARPNTANYAIVLLLALILLTSVGNWLVSAGH